MVASLGHADSYMEDLLAPQDLSFCCSAVVCWNNLDLLSRSCYCKACQNFHTLSELDNLVNRGKIFEQHRPKCLWLTKTYCSVFGKQLCSEYL